MCRTWPKSPQSPLEASPSESLSDLDSALRASSWPRQTSSERCTNVFNSARTRRRNLPSSNKCGSQSRQPHPASSWPHNPTGTASCGNLRRGWAVSRLFPGLTEDSMTQAKLSAGQSRIGFQESARHRGSGTLRSSHRSQTARPGNGPRRSLCRPSPEQILEARLTEVIETATSTCPSALDNDEQATAKLYVQKAAQAADEAWQQTIGGKQGPVVANPSIASLEHPGSAPQEDSDGMDFSAPRKNRLSAPQLQAQLSLLTDRTRLRRLKNTLLSKGAWHELTRIEDLCRAQVSHKWPYHLDACAGSVLTPHDYNSNVQKRLGNRVWGAERECTGAAKRRRE